MLYLSETGPEPATWQLGSCCHAAQQQQATLLSQEASSHDVHCTAVSTPLPGTIDRYAVYLSELVQRLQPGSLAHVAMQLRSSRKPRQAKQNLGPVRPLLCPEEGNGLAGFEAAAAQAHQHGFLVTNSASLYAQQCCHYHHRKCCQISLETECSL